MLVLPQFSAGLAKQQRSTARWEVNRAHPLAQGLLLAVPFNEPGDGRARDLSGYGTYATTSLGSPNQIYAATGSVAFDGIEARFSNESLTFKSSAGPALGGFALSFWCRPSFVSGDGGGYGCGGGGGGAGQTGGTGGLGGPPLVLAWFL